MSWERPVDPWPPKTGALKNSCWPCPGLGVLAGLSQGWARERDLSAACCLAYQALVGILGPELQAELGPWVKNAIKSKPELKRIRMKLNLRHELETEASTWRVPGINAVFPPTRQKFRLSWFSDGRRQWHPT